jgi:serine/threonine-protein kinase
VLLARSGILLVTGTIAAMVAAALRRVVSQAHAKVRADDLFGKYRVGEKLAAGGMGVVYRAVYCPEGGFERDVAVKRVHAHLASQPRVVEAFRREAALCSRLVHPNIVQVLDFGSVDESYFFAMEYVDGMSLAELLRTVRDRNERIPSALVTYIAQEICAGLRCAHDGVSDGHGGFLRVIHRDLSPSNVLLSRQGQVKILDFGIARVLDGAGEMHTTTVAGKLAYMAPEQLTAGTLDQRTDLFALGIVVWEMLCVQPLFAGPSDGATVMAVTQKPIPPPSTIRPDLVGGHWDGWVAHALSRSPQDRFQSARDMLAALEMIAQREGPVRAADLASVIERFSVSLPHGASEQSTLRIPPPSVETPTVPLGERAPP